MKQFLGIVLFMLVISFAVGRQFDAETLSLAAKLKVRNMMSGDYSAEQMLPVIDKAITDGRQSADLYILQGLCYLYSDQLPLAAKSFAKALQLGEYKTEKYEQIADRYMSSGLYANASSTIKELVGRLKSSTTKDEKKITYYENVASVYTFFAYYDSEQDDSAKQEFIKLCKLSDPNVEELLSNVWLETFMRPIVEEPAEECVSIEPEYPASNPQEEDYKEVPYQEYNTYRFLQSCVIEDPSIPLAWKLMSDIDDYYGNYESARANAEKAIKLNPEYTEHFEKLIWYSLELNDFNSAYREYSRLLSSETEVYKRLTLVFKYLMFSAPADSLAAPVMAAPAGVDYEYEYTPREIPEFQLILFDFFAWVSKKYPEDLYSKWFQARVVADYDIYTCRKLLNTSAKQSEYEKSLMAYTYYLEGEYQQAYRLLEQLISPSAIDLVFSDYQLEMLYIECGKYEKLADMAIEHIKKTTPGEDSDFPLYMISDFNDIVLMLNTVKKYGANADQQKIKTSKDVMDYLAYGFLNRLFSSETNDQKRELMAWISNKKTLDYVNLLADTGNETQAKEQIKLVSFSKSDNLFEELMHWGSTCEHLKQYSEALTYYKLANYINEDDNQPLLGMLVSSHKAGLKKEARGILSQIDTSNNWQIIRTFTSNSEMIEEYYDWVTGNLEYNWLIAYALYKSGEYEKTALYIQNMSNMDEDAMSLYNPAQLIASHPGWKPYLSDGGCPLETSTSLFLYHPETIKHDQNSITIWIMFLSTETPENSYDITMTKQLWKIDPIKKQYKTIQGTTYFNDDTVREITASVDWEYPIPDSIGYTIVDHAVKLHKKLTAPPIKK